MSKSSPKSCEACFMPFAKDPAGDTREHPKYCSYCYSGGKLHPDDVSMEDFQKMCFESMGKNGTPWIMAKVFSWSIRFAPYWKERNKKK